VRVRRRILRISCLVAVLSLVLLIAPWSALAQVVEVTPEFEIDPSTETTPWVMYFAVGAAALGAVVLLGVGIGYMRFAPKFFAREEAPRLPPGARPPHLVRQAAAMRWAPPGAPAPPEAPAPEAQEAASSQTTAPPAGERAVQADAVGQAEAEAPEARPSAKTPEETGERQPPEGEAPEEAPSTETPVAAEAPQPAPAAAPAPAPAAGQASSVLDEETFERVLREQIDKGVDRRVAEGRARAAAVVAARRKAQS
jgi:hypothetical protein